MSGLDGVVSAESELQGNISSSVELQGSINHLKVLLLSAYGIAVKNGFEGTEAEWLESLKGAQGEPGKPGEPGSKGDPGEPGAKGAVYVPTVTQTRPDQMVISYDLKDSATSFGMSQTIELPPGAKGDPGEDATDEQVTSAVNAYLAKNPPADGQPGKDGVGIKSVAQTTTSSADGGSNVVTVTKTDGTTSTFTVKNGSKGSKGEPGSPGSPGSKGDPGEPGAAGRRGNSILKVTTAPTAESSTVEGYEYKYKFSLSTILAESGASEVLIGDTIKYSYYEYGVGYVGASYAFAYTRTSIRGSNGTSVTVSSVSESTADGGDNVVTFSDGKTMTVKNGKQGSPGAPGEDGYTPVRGKDYWTPDDVTAMESDISEKVASAVAGRSQLKPEFANNIAECTDTSKMYVLPDGYIYAYMLTEKEVSTGGGYTNLIDGTNGYIKDGQRYSASSAAFKPLTGGASIIIPVPTSGSITVRVRGMKYHSGYPTVYGGTTNTTFTNCFNDTVVTRDTYDTNGDWYFTFTNTKSMSYIVTTGILTGTVADVIATVNEEIIEGGTEIITEYAWVSTGHAFVPADYENRIIDLETQTAKNTADITNLKNGVGSTTAIKDWDAPIYDANIPVFQLSAEKAAMTNATNTPASIYAKYDALMAKHPRYITKTDLGLCSDGVNHVYRYDFREPEPLHESNKEWSETKAKAIIITGIHFEWAGIYAMYNALEEIADNPELKHFRRNTHLIVVPVANPYATIAGNYDGSQGVRNANGVEIHRNFEVDWVASTAGTTHYGGSAPLSEVETQYIDNIMKNNTDAAFFLSCHNCGVDTFWGTGFIWASTATKYMCNMGYRVIDKLSDAWMEKYGDVLSVGIAEYKTDSLEDGETRLGWTGLSTSPGTEAKQATKYGIQGTNVEICNPFQIHGTKANPEPSMSAFTMSRGAEVYTNFLLTAFGVYDPKDKKEYAPNLPWSE